MTQFHNEIRVCFSTDFIIGRAILGDKDYSKTE